MIKLFQPQDLGLRQHLQELKQVLSFLGCLCPLLPGAQCYNMEANTEILNGLQAPAGFLDMLFTLKLKLQRSFCETAF